MYHKHIRYPHFYIVIDLMVYIQTFYTKNWLDYGITSIHERNYKITVLNTMAYYLFFGLCSLYPFPLIHSHVDKQSIGFLCVQYNSTLHRKWNFLCIRKQYLYHAIMEKGFDKRICSRKIILSNDELERQTTAVQCSAFL